VASTISGFLVSPILHQFGFDGLLLAAAVCVWGASQCSDSAYEIAEQVRVDIVDEIDTCAAVDMACELCR
jgi:hypothetical protein